ncbi:hypothetical protein M422DRAFT_259029 [Sphaerobolus stellatus SS14]|uniref:Uncharacterized protein n=1 Tax=Sphaerobolus stellatus (strain SS14) TaxID=990650 RepID=A0A0C9U5X0_SPHS4|nr:hypothetical protein M422DRAFT_259029 [Sphaerobolus stellatus SS14]
MIATGGPFPNTGHHGVLHIRDLDIVQIIYEEAGTYIGRFGRLSFGDKRGIEGLREKPQDDPGTGTDKQEHGTLNL